MADEDVLPQVALGDETALLQTQALANVAAGGIGPDPSARPRPTPKTLTTTSPSELTTTSPSEKDLRWGPNAISVVVQTHDGRAFGRADLGGRRTLLSNQVTLSVKRDDPSGFSVIVRFLVDGINRSRRPPFTPPQVGTAWKFRPEGAVTGVL